MGGSIVVMPAMLTVAVMGVGKQGGELPGRPMRTCCWGVAVTVIGGYAEAGSGPNAGGRGAKGLAIAVSVGALVVVVV